MRAHRLLPLFLLYISPAATASIGTSEQYVLQLADQLPLDDAQKPVTTKRDTLPVFLDALDVLQDEYFALWQGIWPTGIDWTSAVIGTYLSASLSTISASFSSLTSSKSNENLINKYFSQLTAYYFGQDAFALRQEAYDDILWVVLGWLESIKFINKHSELHYTNGYWYGQQWIPAFAHRARLFWEIGSQGWNTSLCNGGMIWSPWLVPYKNAITNELFISASISMYLYFPGDSNPSPFSFPSMTDTNETLLYHAGRSLEVSDRPGMARDPKYLAAAIEAYKWLQASNMTDSQGLYFDGFHISGWARNNSNNTQCDVPSMAVFTYNQGVLLSGQRGLYESTGAKSYLEDGHALIANVIAATGWDNDSQSPINDTFHRNTGLGRGGVLQEICDMSGTCSQDTQTFKGIFFQHFTQFCAQLPWHLDLPIQGTSVLEEVRKWHDGQCASYAPWLKHNANAALKTRNSEGKYGMWWGASEDAYDDYVSSGQQAADLKAQNPNRRRNSRNIEQLRDQRHGPGGMKRTSTSPERVMDPSSEDLNDRFRGRTLETQGGGVAVLRALWEVVDSRA